MITVHVSYGVQNRDFSVEQGTTLAAFVALTLSTLGVAPGADIAVNGQMQPGTYSLNDGDRVEVRKTTGTKG